MNLTNLRTFMQITVTAIGIIFIILLYFFPTISIVLLSTELVLLPAIYIIGNNYIEKKLKVYYNLKLNKVLKDTDLLLIKYPKLKQKNLALIKENHKLKKQIKHGVKYGKEKNKR